jgi:hypothetical protein
MPPVKLLNRCRRYLRQKQLTLNLLAALLIFKVVISPSTFDAFRELRRLSIVGTEKRCARTATRQYLVTYLASNKETQGIELFRFFVSFRAATLLPIFGEIEIQQTLMMGV